MNGSKVLEAIAPLAVIVMAAIGAYCGVKRAWHWLAISIAGGVILCIALWMWR